MRLDKYIQKLTGSGKSEARLRIARGDVCVEGEQIRDNLHEVAKLDRVEVRGIDTDLTKTEKRRYIMLNKPAGCVSATTDPEHETVIDLIDTDYAESLHIAGRLDKESTGLIILTNDGQWSRRITEPVESVAKRYRVETEKEIAPETVVSFSEGFYFAYEDITTLPAELEILGEKSAIVTICEGKYHQIKRMFHAVGNRVVSLHRQSVGKLVMDKLAIGEYRELSKEEIAFF